MRKSKTEQNYRHRVQQVHRLIAASLDEPVNITALANEREDQNIRTIKLAAGRYARYRHTGPYNTLEQAYNTFYGQWLPDSGYECADQPPFEIYINSPYDTPEADLITDIYMPVKDK
ncbi:GyrI-like domain-containing protein [Jinshanibacter sp. LJY008]|uniref:GyrI-like domain-containing protein n=1 Tax=Limnobaculum eriocheiris TaxID=2897391 RepID=A0A9X1MZ16_9GAMM|nr:GyrI-like domain-containing protein [Limnobaculum eriocheiris]MCD1126327.1 GyrI-like domain-containing protein [Limnobaculum eriocheiris]